MDPSSRRTTGIAGIVFVVLAIAVLVLSGDGDFSRADAPLRDALTSGSRQGQSFAAIAILPIAVAALLWFVAGLRSLLRGDANSGLPSAAAIGGTVFATTFLIGVTLTNAVSLTLAFTDRYQFEPGVARLTLALGVVFLTGALAGAAVLIAAASIAGRRVGLLPAWLTRSGYVVAVLALVSILLFAAPYVLIALWILAASVLLLRQAPGGEPGAAMPGQRAEEAAAERRTAERP